MKNSMLFMMIAMIVLVAGFASALDAKQMMSIEALPVPADTISELNLLTRDVDTFFTKLISTKAEIDRGEMIFEFNNPFSIPFDASMLTNYYEQNKNLNVIGSEMFMLSQKEVLVPVYEEIYINKTCEKVSNSSDVLEKEPLLENEILPSKEKLTYDCGYYEQVFKENKTEIVEYWQPIKEIPTGKNTIKIVYHWDIKLGKRAVDIVPSLIIPKTYTDLKISNWEFKAQKWAWFNTSYDKRIPINCSGMSAGSPLVINGSTGFDLGSGKQIVWTNCQENLSVYYFSTNTTRWAIANDTSQVSHYTKIGNVSNYNGGLVFANNSRVYLLNNFSNAVNSSLYTLSPSASAPVSSSGITGTTGEAYTFTRASSQNLNTSDEGLPVGSNASTFCGWYKLSLTNVNSVIVSYGLWGTLQSARAQGITNTPQYDFTVYGGAQRAGTPSTNWVYHCSVITSPSTVSHYVNGSYIGGGTGTGVLTTVLKGTNGFTIGSSSGNGDYTNGTIQDVMVWNENKSATFLNKSYQNYVGTVGFGTLGSVESGVSDAVPPTWSSLANNASSTSKVGSNVSFTIKLNDETNLSSFIFSTNNTGTWTNQSAVSISGLEYNATATIIVNKTRGNVLCGLFYVYDAGTNLNTSNVSCFTVADTVPTAPTTVTITPATAYKNSTLNCSISGGTDADGDAITYIAQFMDTNNSTILQGYSSTLTFNCSANANCTHFDTVYCRGISSTAIANSTATEASRYINNTMPTSIVNVTLNSATHAGKVLNFTGAGCSDIDNDAISYFYQVYNLNQSVIRQNFSTSQTYTLQNADITNTLRVTSFCGDAYVNNTANATANVVVADGTNPTYSNLSNNASSSTNAGDIVVWTVTLSDNYKLSNYIFSTNNTGTWTNDTTTAINPNICYQENISDTVDCLNSAQSNYSGAGAGMSWDDSASFDNNWDTYSHNMFDVGGVSYTYNFTYFKPNATTYDAVWVVKTGRIAKNNYVIPQTCLKYSANNISLRLVLYSNHYGWSYDEIFCYDGTWVSIYHPSAVFGNQYIDFYEEGLWWNFDGLYTLDVSKVVNQSGGNQVCGKFYFNDTSNNQNETANSCFIVLTSPTSAPAIITPIATAYEGMINITYNASTGNSSISFYNISLLNANESFNSSIIENNTELFYNWNSSSATNANWKVKVEAVTVYGEKNSSTSELFSTHNFAVATNISSTIYAGENATCNFTVTGTDATANLTANIFFYVNNTLSDSKTVNVTSGTETGVEFNVTLFNAGDTVFCRVQPADDALTSSINYDTAHIAVLGASVSGFGLCTNTSNQTALWIYSKDEATKGALNATVQFTAQYWITSPSYATNLSTVFSGNSTYRICLNTSNTTVNADIYIIYTAGFTERWFVYNGSLSTANPPNITIYNFANTTDVCKLQLTTRDATTYNYFPNTYGVLQRFYVGNSNETTWTNVQMDKSSDFGVEFFNVVEQTVDYRLQFYDLQNRLLKQTGNMKFLCTSCLCTLNVLMSPYASTASAISATPTMVYNETTKIVNVSWNDGTGSISSVRTLVTKESASQTITICNSLVTGAIGSSSCNVSAYSGNLHIQVFKNLNASSTISEWVENANTKLRDIVGENETTFWGMGIELTLIIAGAIISPVGAVIMMMFGLIINMFLGMMSFLTATFLIVAGTLSVIIALKVKT